ncbi:peptidase inhibitor family I36 protein [Streptomyces sp. NBS 14/10]|uniref:peptidase inhibitor family I36 protein n=1 Tax=Streptomyces sp. NBS 14/10 TaxID=1945643 RepID=UPI000B7D5BCA|nr:peptidase inhibitor family I36 protein [Streptomyces sp. NBS 14/10]KAK1179199.1 peptidase inhibitor family I36 protein [Streptomyces sp. NBS 14/10]
MRRTTAAALSAVVLGAVGVLGAQPSAFADPRTDTLQRQIDETLANTQGGRQISDYEIAWDGGAVIMAFPLPGEEKAPPSSPAAQKLQAKLAGKPYSPRQAADTRADDDCPTEAIGNDWYCFWDGKNFTGQRVTWNAVHKEVVLFNEYDFQNEATSWSNKGGLIVKAFANNSKATCQEAYDDKVPTKDLTLRGRRGVVPRPRSRPREPGRRAHHVAGGPAERHPRAARRRPVGGGLHPVCRRRRA